MDEQIETGTTNIQIKDSEFKKDYTRPQTRGDTTGKPTTHSMNSSRRDLRSRKGLHQKHLSTQLSRNAKMTASNQINVRMKGSAPGMQDSASEQRPAANKRSSKTKMSQKADPAKDYQAGLVHVPRKFARRHARGVSFNSTGKGLGDRVEELPSPRPQVNSLVYDKATLEAEKERERLQK